MATVLILLADQQYLARHRLTKGQCSMLIRNNLFMLVDSRKQDALE